MAKKTKRKQPREEVVEEEDLDRFAGSSDEDEDADSEDEQMAPPAASGAYDDDDHHDADVENDADEESEDENDGVEKEENAPDDQSVSSTDSLEEQMVDPASKMANAMGRILGGLHKPKGADQSKATTTSVVLGKTVTPLQKLQQKEKEKLKALKEKRQAKKERSLSALHYPLSIATSNTVQTEGRLSVAKELEQERFHRRVATRGVVALFNAISRHQRSSNEQKETPASSTTKKQDVSKMTKHSFLDKIKSAAKSKDVSQGGEDKKRKHESEGRDDIGREKKNPSSWSALNDDYMLNPKKNWDEESSDEEVLQTEITEEAANEVEREAPRKKQRAGGRQ